MRVRVRYFAKIREIVGRDEEHLDVADGSSIADVYGLLCEREPSLGRLRYHLRAARNQEFEDFEALLQEGDELAFIPPVSGGAPRFLVTMERLSVDAVVDCVRRPEAGAIVTFQGVVRNHTGDREVIHLEYDAYVEMSEKKLRETAAEAEERWPVQVAVHHRYGRMEIGETAVVIAVSSPHRAEAFEACRWVIDRLKEVVPIWKKEVGPDGEEWLGRGP